MFGCDENGMTVEYDGLFIDAVVDSVKELNALETERDLLNEVIQQSADAYMAAIDGRIVTREAELLRVKWYKEIDARREVDIKIEAAKADIVNAARGIL